MRNVLYGMILVAAFVINPNVIFTAVFLGGMVFLRAEMKMRTVMFILVGGTIPVLIHLISLNWVYYHADQLMHFSWGLEWTWDYFKNAFGENSAAYFRGVVPFSEKFSLIIFLIFPALTFYALWKKKFEVAFLLGIVSAGVILALGINKVNDGTASVFYPLSRMFLALPLVLTLVLVEMFGYFRNQTIVYSFLLVSGIFSGIQLQRMNTVIAEEVTVTEVPLSITSIHNLRFQTEQLRNFALANSIKYFAGAGYPMKYGDLQLIFHSGEAWYDDYPDCSIPEYERRRWRRDSVLKQKANSTAWFGGDEALWLELDKKSGVVSYDILDLNAYVVQGEETNQQVFGFLGKAIFSGE